MDADATHYATAATAHYSTHQPCTSTRNSNGSRELVISKTIGATFGITLVYRTSPSQLGKENNYNTLILDKVRANTSSTTLYMAECYHRTYWSIPQHHEILESCPEIITTE